jgi:hypothetical protein
MWLVVILAVALCVSFLVIVRLSRATKALLKVIRGYAVQSETSSTCVDRVTYTVALHRTETLGPIE